MREKTEEMKKNIEAKKNSATYKPKINSNFVKKRTSNENKETVFERLYSLSEKEKTEID